MAPVLDFPKKKKNDNKEKKKIQTKTELSAFPFLNKNLEKKCFLEELIILKLKAAILGVWLMFGAISMTSI